jgi:TetR/AcrR family transcriptional regulator, repressor of fatR-cypB operon
MLTILGSMDERPDSIAFLLSEGDPPSRQAILRAALKLFVEKGYDQTTIRAIADEAGYTNPALFKFFKSKEALGLYVFEKTYRELMLVLESVLRDDGPLAGVMAKWAAAFVRLLSERLHAVLFVHDHLPQFWPRVARRFGNRTLFTLMTEWIQRGRKDGRISVAVPIPLQIAAVSGFFHQFATMAHLGEIDARSLPALRDGVSAVLVRILKVDGQR